MATRIGSLLIRLAVEHGILQEGLARAERDVAKTTKAIKQRGQDIVDFGQKMSVAVTLPLAALAKSAVDGFIEQKKAMADVEAALRSMGNASGKTAEELAKTADQIEADSLYDAEIVLKQVTAQLLTFGRISGQEFDRAQQAAVDLAARLDGDLQSAAIMVGKALNDPVKGLTALSKAGIQFSPAQKALIKSLVETGQVAEAQRIILKELETQFRGAAAAAADETPWRAAQVAIGQAMDAIGEAVLPIVKTLSEGVTAVANEFNKLSPEMKQTIIVAGGVAAAIGPVLIVMGTLIQSTAGITAALVTMAGGATAAIAVLGNVALAAAGLGAVIVTLGLNLQQTTALVVAAVSAYAAYRGILLVAAVAQRAWVATVAASEVALLALIRNVGGATTAKAALSGVVATLTGGLRALFATMIANPFTAIAAAVGVLAGAFIGLATAQAQARAETDNLIRSLDASIKARGADVALSRAQADTERQRAQARLDQINAEQARLKGPRGLGSGNRALELEAQELTWKVVELEGTVRLADRTLADMERTASRVAVPIAQTGVAAEGAGKKIRGAADATKAQAEAFQSLYDRLFPYQAATRKFDTELALIQKSRLSDAEKELAIARLIREAYETRTAGLGKATVSFDKKEEGPLVDFKKQFDELQEAMEGTAKRARVQTVQIAESFKDMADKSIQALDRFVGAIKGGGFLDILGSAVNLFLQLASTGLFGKKLAANVNAPRIPGNANGTAFHPGGLMMVGERGPEILQVPRGGRVVPNHELREAGQSAIRIILDERTDIVEARIGRSVATATPAIMDGSAKVTTARLAQRQSRRLG